MQTSAIDQDQDQWATLRAQQREAREQALWKWMLDQYQGRQFLFDMVFATLGPLRMIPLDPPEQVHRFVALHNLAVQWLDDYVGRHRDKYVQMLKEATARDEDQRRADEAALAQWTEQQRLEDWQP